MVFKTYEDGSELNEKTLAGMIALCAAAGAVGVGAVMLKEKISDKIMMRRLRKEQPNTKFLGDN